MHSFSLYVYFAVSCNRHELDLINGSSLRGSGVRSPLLGPRTNGWGCEHSCCRLASIAAVLRLSTDFSYRVWSTGAPLFADLDARHRVSVITWALVAADVLKDVGAHLAILADGSLFSSAPGFVVFQNNAFIRRLRAIL